MNESRILEAIAHTAAMPETVQVGPGDDLAVLTVNGSLLMAGVDQVVMSRHVSEGTTWDLIGRKAVNRALSDVAAMAGRPVAILATGAMATKTTDDEAMSFLAGLRAAAEAAGIPLVGGDLATLPADGGGGVVTVTVLAEPTAKGPLLRSGGRPGDRLYVTGTIGGAWDAPDADHHLTFSPRISEALELHDRCDVHAMIDISDGLGRDAARLAKASHCHARIELASVPCRDGVDPRAAIKEGEDYELLVAAEGEVPLVLSNGCTITEIGRLEAAGECGDSVTIVDGAQALTGDTLGWEHR